jgi:hypothetical protein
MLKQNLFPRNRYSKKYKLLILFDFILLPPREIMEKPFWGSGKNRYKRCHYNYLSVTSCSCLRLKLLYKENKMKALLNALVVLGLIAVPAFADHHETTGKAMEAGKEAMEAGKEAMETGKEAMKDATKEAKTVAKKAGKKAKKVMEETKKAVEGATTTETAPVAPPAH